MQIPILIVPMESNGNRAQDGEPLTSHTPSQSHAMVEFVGMFKDDPLIENWKKSMKAHRMNRDKDRDKP
jgi:ABC-type Fe3+ transport system substrate-binding protein